MNAVLGDASYVARFGALPGAAVDEDLRLRVHLEYVEALLRRADTSALTDEQRAKRARALDHLRAYHERGVFPRNHTVAGRRPHFIDEAGRICAVGYLIEQTAGRAFAEAINARYEWAFVPEIDSTELAVWARASGLTVRELAMIQPSYNWERPPLPAPKPNPNPVRPPPPPPEEEGARQLRVARERLHDARARVEECVEGIGLPSRVRQIGVTITLRRRAVAIEIDKVGSAALRACIDRDLSSRIGGLFFTTRTKPVTFHHAFAVTPSRGRAIDTETIEELLRDAVNLIPCTPAPARLVVTVEPAGRVGAVRVLDRSATRVQARCLRDALASLDLPPFAGRATDIDVVMEVAGPGFTPGPVVPEPPEPAPAPGGGFARPPAD